MQVPLLSSAFNFSTIFVTTYHIAVLHHFKTQHARWLFSPCPVGGSVDHINCIYFAAPRLLTYSIFHSFCVCSRCTACGCKLSVKPEIVKRVVPVFWHLRLFPTELNSAFGSSPAHSQQFAPWGCAAQHYHNEKH